jgi:hypothetical protein
LSANVLMCTAVLKLHGTSNRSKLQLQLSRLMSEAKATDCLAVDWWLPPRVVTRVFSPVRYQTEQVIEKHHYQFPILQRLGSFWTQRIIRLSVIPLLTCWNPRTPFRLSRAVRDPMCLCRPASIEDVNVSVQPRTAHVRAVGASVLRVSAPAIGHRAAT